MLMVIVLAIGLGLPVLIGLLMLSKPLTAQSPKDSNFPYPDC
jgi:hypothetical protein